jgi:hypothetical protein
VRALWQPRGSLVAPLQILPQILYFLKATEFGAHCPVPQ